MASVLIIKPDLPGRPWPPTGWKEISGKNEHYQPVC
jgi:hypothetical protein